MRVSAVAMECVSSLGTCAIGVGSLATLLETMRILHGRQRLWLNTDRAKPAISARHFTGDVPLSRGCGFPAMRTAMHPH